MVSSTFNLSQSKGRMKDVAAAADAQFRKRGYEMVDWICDYYSRVGKLPVRSPVQPGASCADPLSRPGSSCIMCRPYAAGLLHMRPCGVLQGYPNQTWPGNRSLHAPFRDAHQQLREAGLSAQGCAACVITWSSGTFSAAEGSAQELFLRCASGYLAPQLPEEAPENGEPFEAIMRDVNELIIPGARHVTIRV